jgi:hypothetical protein
MTSKVCGTCRHWNAGLCCRFPPVPAPPGPYLAFVFPETTDLMTCGEWHPKNTEPAVSTYTVATDELIERRAE